MEYRLLGRTGVQVSKFCFGTMSFGGDADAQAAAQMYAACRDHGFNFFDCADGYSAGRAEQILGGLIAGHRDELVLASKCFNPTSKDINDRGGTRRHIPRAVEASLKRLGTDRLDILFMHRFEANAPVDETLRALEDLVRAGKVIYLGASNYAAWQIAKSLGVAERRGWTRFDVIQPMYNLVKRQAEVEIFPLAQAEGLGVITYSPVGGGLLSGKFRRGQKPNEGRLVENASYIKRYGDDWMLETAGCFTEYAETAGVHPVTLAVAWAAAHPAVTCPIIGARSLDQLQPSLAALDFDMPAPMREDIARLSRRPPPATDRTEVQDQE
jgi:aryl-alcohol dehydrogenase-like predicted oxidoreductase